MTTPAGSITRQKLMDAATRAFAEHGVENASLLEIARQAGQRNRGAVHYHFGSREGLLVAVLGQYAGQLSERHRALLGALPEDADLGAVLDVLVVPAVELADADWRGRCFIAVVADLAGDDPDALDPQVRAVLAEAGGEPVYELVSARMPDLAPDLTAERLALLTAFVLRAVADRARALERGAERPASRAPLAGDRFTANLVAMAAGMLTAPVAEVAVQPAP
jgi:AcrR family transcriptional regulator